MTGTLHHEDGRHTLRFERRIAHPIERVWCAITEPEGLAAWFPAAMHGERRAGAELTFAFPDEQYPTRGGRMLTFDPPHTLEFDWNGDLLRFELQPHGAGTSLVFTHTFADVGKSARDASGWTWCLDALDAHLGGRAAPDLAPEYFERLFAKYTQAFGPEASTKREPEED
ncbi:MAG: SRPBCC family protein [Cytophagaceae bacterium]|nr:SRPBCC family protein [Gemmatimonadaceae bacterium]